MQAKCNIDNMKESIDSGFKTINDTLILYAKNKENYDEQRDGHWSITRGTAERVKVLEEKSDRLDSYLKSDDPMRPGVLTMIEIRLQRLENTISISNDNIKTELETFKNFIMKIIWSIGGGLTAVIGIGGLITWVINIIK